MEHKDTRNTNYLRENGGQDIGTTKYLRENGGQDTRNTKYRIQEIQNTWERVEDMDTRNTKYLRKDGSQVYKKYKIPEREWRTWIQEIQNT